MVKIYTDQSFLIPEHRSRVFPLLFDLFYRDGFLVKQCFVLTEVLSDADIAVLPVDLGFYFSQKRESEFKDFIENAQKYKVSVWVYSGGDFGISFKAPNVTLFRLGGFDSELDENVEVMPSFVSDPYEYLLEGEFSVLEKGLNPSIGFIGHANGSGFKLVKEFLVYLRNSGKKILKIDYSDYQSFFSSGIERYKILKELENNKNIHCNFIYRKKYRAGANNEKSRKDSSIAFFKNINDNLYTFCIRGAGNFSVRFYETLIMGRIPVLVDTDCRLPLSEFVNWSEHCIIANKNNIADKLLEFHNKHNNEELKEIQKRNRKLILDILSRENYFIKIAGKRILKK